MSAQGMGGHLSAEVTPHGNTEFLNNRAQGMRTVGERRDFRDCWGPSKRKGRTAVEPMGCSPPVSAVLVGVPRREGTQRTRVLRTSRCSGALLCLLPSRSPDPPNLYGNCKGVSSPKLGSVVGT